MMKSKYERMSKEEKRNVYEKYKKDKPELTKKLERILLFSKIGIGLSIFMFIYDFVLVRNKFNYWIDILLLVLCIITLVKVNSTKKSLLNDYVVKNAKNKYKKKD